MELQGIVFDKDGTLFGFTDTWAIWCERTLGDLAPDDPALQREMADAAGYDLQSRRFRPGSVVVGGAADETNVTWASFLPNMSLSDVEAVGLRHLLDLPQQPVCDLHSFTGKLRGAGFVLGVATNDFEENARRQLEHEGVAASFDFICGYDSGFGVKPGPGMIVGFCEQMSLKPEQVAMVGDSCHDLLAGKAAGVGRVIGVLTGPAVEADIAPFADVVLPSIEELPAYLGVS